MEDGWYLALECPSCRSLIPVRWVEHEPSRRQATAPWTVSCAQCGVSAVLKARLWTREVEGKEESKRGHNAGLQLKTPPASTACIERS